MGWRSQDGARPGQVVLVESTRTWFLLVLVRDEQGAGRPRADFCMAVVKAPSNASSSFRPTLQWALIIIIPLIVFLVLWSSGPTLSPTHCGVLLDKPQEKTSVHSSPSSSDPLIIRTEFDFCSPLRDFSSTNPSNSVMRFLHKGKPPFWVSLPLPDHAHLALDAVKSGGWVNTAYDEYQTYVEDASEDAIILDVGGHYGFTGLPIAATGRRVIAFEPVPRNQRIHMLGVCFNGFFDRYTLVRGAVGAVEGNATLYVPTSDWTDNAALGVAAAEYLKDVIGKSEPVEVRVYTLDSFASKYLSDEDVARIAFVKVDVQGFETNVIRGGKKLFSRLSPGTLITTEHEMNLIGAAGFKEHEDVDALVALGYSVHADRAGPEIPREEWNANENLWFIKL